MTLTCLINSTVIALIFNTFWNVRNPYLFATCEMSFCANQLVFIGAWCNVDGWIEIYLLKARHVHCLSKWTPLHYKHKTVILCQRPVFGFKPEEPNHNLVCIIALVTEKYFHCVKKSYANFKTLHVFHWSACVVGSLAHLFSFSVYSQLCCYHIRSVTLGPNLRQQPISFQTATADSEQQKCLAWNFFVTQQWHHPTIRPTGFW